MIFYEGPSVLDGKPIVGIATAKSKNRKTGNMVQTWILRSDIDPVQAMQQGEDASICGQCPHRTGEVRTCYVNLGQAPLAVYRAYKRGSYDRGSLDRFTGRTLRMGAYGDPVAIPWSAWRGLPKGTGYTHQWRRHESMPFRGHLMASCDSELEQRIAGLMGWRTFLVRPEGQSDPLDGMIECPSYRGVQCTKCGLCAGNTHPDAPSVWIKAHGTAKAFV